MLFAALYKEDMLHKTKAVREVPAIAPKPNTIFCSCTARKSLISTGLEPPVCTGFPTGTAPPVLSARALSTGQLARLVPVGNTNRY